MKARERTLNKLEEIGELVPEVVDQYKWLSDMAFAPIKSEDDVQIAMSGHSNPTEQTALDLRNQRMASALRAVDKDISEAKRRVLASLRKLLKAFPKEEGEPVASAYHDQPGLRLITSTELDEAWAMKAKREAQGQGFGRS